jgi:glycosyltransferase involved in cell wall biosynthesis
MKNQFDVLAPNVRKIVSKPEVTKNIFFNRSEELVRIENKKRFFFYPTFSRPFKKIEDFLKIAEFFYRLDCLSFNFYLTLTGKENNYSRWLFKKFGHLPNIVWLGKVNRAQVFNLYEQSDCLIFTSHLETWGLPLTEFSLTNKTIIAPDLPYVHETLAGYPKLALYEADNVIGLLELSLRLAEGIFIEYSDTLAENSDHHSVDGWNNLLSLIID